MRPDHNGWAIILGPSGTTRFPVKRIKDIPAYRVDRLYDALGVLDRRLLPLGQLPDSRTPSHASRTPPAASTSQDLSLNRRSESSSELHPLRRYACESVDACLDERDLRQWLLHHQDEWLTLMQELDSTYERLANRELQRPDGSVHP
ncbi:hypothetical protein N7488_000105 [Penicillium malachiteum]|nr:hypothetical protein N7488_000105 [Penicillium malachiteum]